MNSFMVNLIWLKTEYRRAASTLPVVLKRAVILIIVFLAVVGMIAFCAFNKAGESSGEPLVRIGYAADDDMLTRLAVSYVESMESVKSLCSLEKTTETEGKRRLEEGELSALIVLPENVINEILSGSNTPARLYLPEAAGEGVTGSRIFEELANAGLNMLQTAQAQIYAATDLSVRLGQSERLQPIYDDINRFNLGLVGGRERLFKKQLLSATENNSYAVYYSGAFLAVYLLLAGMFLGEFCKRSRFQQRMIKRRAGVPYMSQLLSRIAAALPLFLIILAIPLLLPLLPGVNAFLSYAVSGENMAELLLVCLMCLIFAAVYAQLIYQLAEEMHGVIIIFGISAVFQGYMSGCFVPSALLPDIVMNIGRYLPAAYLRAGFTMLFTGNTAKLSKIICGLFIWSALCLVAAWGTMHYLGNEEDSALTPKVTRVSFKTPLFFVLFKRLLHQKSLWICLGITVILSAAVTTAERGSVTRIYAAVYDESGYFAGELAAYDGLVQFVICDNEEEVRRLVLSDDVECGYALSSELSEAITEKNSKNLITVYEDGDAVAARIVDEVLYSALFEKAAYAWFAEYMVRCDGFGELTKEKVYDALKPHTMGTTTFRFDIKHIGAVEANEEEEDVTFPVQYAIFAGVLLCAVQGMEQTLIDIRKNRFYKRNRLVISMITISQPVLLGIAAGIITLFVAR